MHLTETSPTTLPKTKIYTVSQLNLESKLLLESHFLKIWVSGEISNLSTPTSGHIYFSLKDENCQVRCAMFRMQKSILVFQPQNGMQILVQAKVSLYDARGDYQLIVDYMEPLGDGLLRQNFERLKAKLMAEGLFDEKYKKTLPAFPNTVGLITSSTGAAVRDILSVLNRRFPLIKVIIYAAEVQGKNAAATLIDALKYAEKQAICDVLIIARGGGSLEDLQPFNEEILARAVFECPIPIVSGIGHEVDTTIVDFVADKRAATPTAAAELISPDQNEWLQRLQHYRAQLQRAIETLLNSKNQTLDYYSKRLRHPRQLILDKKQKLDELFSRLLQTQQHYLLLQKNKLSALARALDIVSPLSTLNRGYAIVSNENGKVICDAKDTNVNDKVTVKFSESSIQCVVIEKK